MFLTFHIQIAMKILNSGRFSMGSSGAGILKKLIGKILYLVKGELITYEFLPILFKRT